MSENPVYNSAEQQADTPPPRRVGVLAGGWAWKDSEAGYSPTISDDRDS